MLILMPEYKQGHEVSQKNMTASYKRHIHLKT